MTRKPGRPARSATSWYIGADGKAVLVLSCGHHVNTTWETNEVPPIGTISKRCPKCPRS